MHHTLTHTACPGRGPVFRRLRTAHSEPLELVSNLRYPAGRSDDVDLFIGVVEPGAFA